MRRKKMSAHNRSLGASLSRVFTSGSQGLMVSHKLLLIDFRSLYSKQSFPSSALKIKQGPRK
jgi:hypothetical protein